MLSIILSRTDFREYDQIISLYTSEIGKVEALARGVKKIISKNAAHLEPFSLVEAEIIRGKEIEHLIKAQSINFFVNIRQDLQKSLMADFAVKLIDLLVEVKENDKGIFVLLFNFLHFLDQEKEIKNIFLDFFVLKLFSLLGFTPILDKCVVCNNDSKKISGFYFSGGGVVCQDCKKEKITQKELVADFDDWTQNIFNGVLVKDFNELKFDSKEKDSTIHRIIFDYVGFHTVKKVSDWRKM